MTSDAMGEQRADIPRAQESSRATTASINFLKDLSARSQLLWMKTVSNQSAMRYALVWGIALFMFHQTGHIPEPHSRLLGSQPLPANESDAEGKLKSLATEKTDIPLTDKTLSTAVHRQYLMKS